MLRIQGLHRRFAGRRVVAAAAPFGRALDLVGDLGVLTGGLGVDVALDRVGEAGRVQQAAVAVLQVGLQREGQLGSIRVVFPLLGRARDRLQVLVQLGQALVHQLQVRDLVDEGALLGIDDVGIGRQVDAQLLRRGHRLSRGDHDLLDLDLLLDDLGLDDLRPSVSTTCGHDFLDDLRRPEPGRR